MNKNINTGKQFIAYAGVGAIGTAVHYLILILMVELVNLSPVVASSCGAITGAFVNYYLNYRFTFNSNKSHKEAITKFMIVALAGFVINLVIMWLLTSVIVINYLIAQVITTGVVLVANYSANRFWTF